MARLILTLFLLLPGLLRAESNPVGMLQMLDYMAVDYASADNMLEMIRYIQEDC